MTTLTNDQIDSMSKAELRTACKARGIKHGKLSILQQRDALKAMKAEPLDHSLTDEIKMNKKGKKVRAKQDGPRAGSKMALALEICKVNKGKDRKDILKLFMDKAKLTKAGASTYYQLVQKRLK